MTAAPRVRADRQAEAVVKAARAPLAARALDGLAHGVFVFDDKLRVQLISRPMLGLLGFTREAVPVGHALAAILERSTGFSAAAAVLQLCAQSVGGDGPTQTHRLDLAGGAAVAMRVCRIAPRRWLAEFEPLAAMPPAEAPAAALSGSDPLTGLADRQAVRERLEAALARRPVLGRPQVVSFRLDLDGFKAIGDSLGEPVADALLRAVADRLRSALRFEDIVARVGRDEFLILQESPEHVTPEAIAARLLDLLGRPYILHGNLLNVGANIGHASAPADCSNAEDLLRCADLALRQAKASGRGKSLAFEPAMQARAQARLALEQDLRKALALAQFELHYQPQVSLHTGRLAGFEALLRWRTPDRGLVSPLEFVPICEELGLIKPIGEWVLRAACQEAARWPDGIRVAVNVSAPQFEAPSRLVAAVRTALARSGLPGGRLELEITESVLLQPGLATLEALHAIRDMGVRISMDDFGTGYSSLTQLQSFPFDKIKIDRSFVSGAAGPEGAAIVRAVAALGASLGMAITAEGVETGEQLDRIRADGCTEVQGYFFGRPVPSHDIDGLIAALALRREPAEA
ncbi:MAG: EAL domain-containing protein [Acidisphaera sp.]|nr:EAL domain-containing protein [Acidisphaera sp.]